MERVGRMVKALANQFHALTPVIRKGCHIITCLHSLPSWSAAAIQSYANPVHKRQGVNRPAN